MHERQEGTFTCQDMYGCGCGLSSSMSHKDSGLDIISEANKKPGVKVYDA